MGLNMGLAAVFSDNILAFTRSGVDTPDLRMGAAKQLAKTDEPKGLVLIVAASFLVFGPDVAELIPNLKACLSYM